MAFHPMPELPASLKAEVNTYGSSSYVNYNGCPNPMPLAFLTDAEKLPKQMALRHKKMFSALTANDYPVLTSHNIVTLWLMLCRG